MAEHVVPQDVEAEDKIIGPFGIRQFIYLAIAGGFGVISYFLIMANVMLAPVAAVLILLGLFLIILSLPLRKEQPTEIYLAAVARYALKSQTRTWIADGEMPIVEIAAPTIDTTAKIKEIPSDEVSRRLSFLANISDTQGWSTRGATAPLNQAIENSNLNEDFAYDAVNASDILDDSRISSSIDNKLDQSASQIRQNAMQMMANAEQQIAESAAQSAMAQSMPQPAPAPPSAQPMVYEQYTPQPVAYEQPTPQPISQPEPPQYQPYDQSAYAQPPAVEYQPMPVSEPIPAPANNPYDVYNAPPRSTSPPESKSAEADIMGGDNSIIDVKFH